MLSGKIAKIMEKKVFQKILLNLILKVQQDRVLVHLE